MGFQVVTDGVARSYDAQAAPAVVLPVGAVAELAIGGTAAMAHVFHMHVNPFQLQDSLGDGAYFQKGDWHDTLQHPAGGRLDERSMLSGSSTVRVRLQTDAFTGTVAMHCHYLVHEDQGMMGTLQIAGVEGTQYAGALGKCYRSSTPDEWVGLTQVGDAASLRSDDASRALGWGTGAGAGLAVACAALMAALHLQLLMRGGGLSRSSAVCL